MLRGGRRSSDWKALVPGLASVVVAVLMTKTEGWRFVGIDVLTPAAFEDLRQVTSTADCARTMVGWNISFGSCDPWHRPYNYPEVWARTLAILHLGEAQASYIGFALIVLFGACMAALTSAVRRTNRSPVALCSMTVAAISPPALFALERGNIDIVVFAMTVVGGLAVARKASSLAALLAGSAAVLKLFPLGLLAMIVSVRRRRAEAVVVFILTAGVGLLLMIPQLPYILGGTPWTTQQSFGVAVVPLALQGLAGTGANPATARVTGLVIFCITLLILQIALRSGLRRTSVVSGYQRLVVGLARDDGARALVLGGGGCVLVAYLGGTSWDYRLIFLIPVLAGLLHLERATEVRAALGVVMVALIVNFWTGRAVEPWIGIGWFVLAPLLSSLIVDVTCTVAAGPLSRLRSFSGAPGRESHRATAPPLDAMTSS